MSTSHRRQRHFDLRHALAHRAHGDQLPQARMSAETGGAARRNYACRRRTGAALAKTDQRALRCDVADRKAGAPPVAPFARRAAAASCRPGPCRSAPGNPPAPALLCGACVRASMCWVAQPPQRRNAGSAARGAPTIRAGSRLRRAVERALAVQRLRFDGLSGQRPVDEHDLALGVARDAAALGVQRRDVERQALCQRFRNSRQGGVCCVPIQSRSCAHSCACCASECAPRILWKRSQRR